MLYCICPLCLLIDLTLVSRSSHLPPVNFRPAFHLPATPLHLGGRLTCKHNTVEAQGNIFLAPLLTLPVDFPVFIDAAVILPEFQIGNVGFRFDLSLPLFLCPVPLSSNSVSTPSLSLFLFLFVLSLSHSRSRTNHPTPSHPLVS